MYRLAHFACRSAPFLIPRGATENYADPRFGATLTIPRLNWVLRGFYGRYYQAPPLVSIQGPLLAYANENNTGFTSLRGERDEEHEFSIQIPYRGWALEVDNFKTRVNNFLDHSNIGESNVFIPITVDGALVRAWEATLRSPLLWRHGQFHLAYSNQIAEQRGAITGGLICTSNCDTASTTRPSITTSGRRSTPDSPPPCRCEAGSQAMSTTDPAFPTAPPA